MLLITGTAGSEQKESFRENSRKRTNWQKFIKLPTQNDKVAKEQPTLSGIFSNPFNYSTQTKIKISKTHINNYFSPGFRKISLTPVRTFLPKLSKDKRAVSISYWDDTQTSKILKGKSSEKENSVWLKASKKLTKSLKESSHLITTQATTFLTLPSTTTPGSNSSKVNETTCITNGGAFTNKTCIFPFIFNREIHTSCIWFSSHLPGHKPWCSTMVDKKGHHIEGKGKWGNCATGCPISPE